MLMDKYLARRWRKAREYDAQDVVRLDKIWWSVKSSNGGWYNVSVILSPQGKLRHAWCRCADHGECHYCGVPVCKHVLAAALAATNARAAHAH